MTILFFVSLVSICSILCCLTYHTISSTWSFHPFAWKFSVSPKWSNQRWNQTEIDTYSTRLLYKKNTCYLEWDKPSPLFPDVTSPLMGLLSSRNSFSVPQIPEPMFIFQPSWPPGSSPDQDSWALISTTHWPLLIVFLNSSSPAQLDHLHKIF